MSIAAVEHARLIAGEKRNCAGDISGSRCFSGRVSLTRSRNASGMIIGASVSVDAGVSTLTAIPSGHEIAIVFAIDSNADLAAA